MFSFLLGIYLGVKLLGHMITICLIFSDFSNNHFPKQLHHFAFPLAMYEGFSFSTSSSTTIIIHLSGKSNFNEFKVEFHCGFGEISIQILCSFKKVGYSSFYY